jgi:hypothetical protein
MTYIFRKRNVKPYGINNKIGQKRHIWTGLFRRMEDGRHIKEEIKMEKIFTKTSEEWYEHQSRSVCNFDHEGL